MGHNTLALLLLGSLLLLPTSVNPQDLPPTPQPSHPSDGAEAGNPVARTRFVGDAACFSCHRDQSASYRATAHQLASQLANRNSILGTFTQGFNILAISDPSRALFDPTLYFKMEMKDDGYYETAVAEWGSHVQTRSERIDIVTGSGVRAQTYLFWHGDQLFELPVSYWADGRQWINSPGFQDGLVNFVRPIYPRCLECHATYIQTLSPDPLTNRYNKASLVTGISCETCHGPGADHIALQKDMPSNPRRQSILNPATFSRDRQVDLCALCHNGIKRESLGPSFTYVPGQPLDKYLKPIPVEEAEPPDVHGDQVGLLKRSRCYGSSPQMSCSTCHDVHAPEKPAADYSARCLTCHQVKSCGMYKRMGRRIATNCIDCHMPVLPTGAIVSSTAGHVVRAKLRTHWIRVYSDVPNP